MIAIDLVSLEISFGATLIWSWRSCCCIRFLISRTLGASCHVAKWLLLHTLSRSLSPTRMIILWYLKWIALVMASLRAMVLGFSHFGIMCCYALTSNKKNVSFPAFPHVRYSFPVAIVCTRSGDEDLPVVMGLPCYCCCTPLLLIVPCIVNLVLQKPVHQRFRC